MGTVFNRNIITDDDLKNLAEASPEKPKTLKQRPPAGVPPTGGAGGPGGVPVGNEDDYLTKLVKYVPIEVLSLYLLLSGVIVANVTKPHDKAIWLFWLLVGSLVVTILYDVQVLGVVRITQVVVSVVGVAVYVFALGGWFATTTWYHVWYASIAVPLFTLGVALIKLKPLPLTAN